MPKLSLLLLLLISCSQLLAAPKPELWDRWSAHKPDSIESIEHGVWSELLQRYVRPGEDGINRFAYGELSTADRAALDSYIGQLSQTVISRHDRRQQLAFWINLYNAVTVQEVLRYFPLDSIRKISSGLFSPGPWGKKLVEVEGEALSLNDIEHRILRPIWRDPRIHYAVNCASLGCPNLQTTAYTAQRVDGMLERAATEFINHPRAVAIVDGELRVSSIYDWFIEDFGGNEAAVIKHLKQYAAGELLQQLEDFADIDDDHYDWRINSLSHADG